MPRPPAHLHYDRACVGASEGSTTQGNWWRREASLFTGDTNTGEGEPGTGSGGGGGREGVRQRAWEPVTASVVFLKGT